MEMMAMHQVRKFAHSVNKDSQRAKMLAGLVDWAASSSELERKQRDWLA